MLSLLTFPIFFMLYQIVDWDLLRSTANSQVLLHGLHSTISLKASGSKFDEFPGLGSSLNDVLPDQNFKNQFYTWWSVMTP